MGSLPTNCCSSKTVPIWVHAILEHGGWNTHDQTSPAWTLPQGQQLSPDFLLYCGVLSMCWSSGQENLVPLYGPQPPSGQIHLFHHGLIYGLQHGMPCSAGICSMTMVYGLWYTMDCRGTASSTISLCIGCKGVLAPGAPLSSPSSLTWVSARFFSLSFSHSSLSAAVAQFFLLLKFAVPEEQLT